ncbi:MAG: hypothetical protein ABIH20_05250 [Candidatus Diapherotrites archaeon]
MKNQIFIVCLVLSVVLFSGCTQQPVEGTQDIGQQANTNSLDSTTEADSKEEVGVGGNTPIKNNADAQESSEETGLKFSEWKASDNSITLQVPEGWTAIEKQVDNCTVDWSVSDVGKKNSAYMTNQIMVLKSEEARQMYKLYGLTGIDNAPVFAYMNAELASSQIVAPLSGSSNLQVVETDAEITMLFSQAVCIQGLAACDAEVFEATYKNNGLQMKGKYFVQTFDLGEGTTWWINVWGYTSPANQWEESKAVLEEIFTSVKYTEDWAAKCKSNTDTTSSIISEIVRKRQESAEKTTTEWDNYIRS